MSTRTCASYENVEKVRAEVRESLKPLFERARREGLWFRWRYQDIWFSPKELEAEQSRDRFLWGQDNWTLDDPKEHLGVLKRRVESAQREFREFSERLTR